MRRSKAIDIDSAAELFASQRDMLHTTSVLKYPVFYKGKTIRVISRQLNDQRFFHTMLLKCSRMN